MKTSIIYHKDCADGFMAAYLTYKVASLYSACTLYPMHYGDTVPDITDDEIYIVDFSLPMDVLMTLANKNINVLLLDHHASAFKMLSPDHKNCDIIGKDEQFGYGSNNLIIILNNTLSGCGLVEDVVLSELCNDDTTPLTFYTDRVKSVSKAIQDRDLWLFELPDTDTLCLMMDGVNKTIKDWDDVLINMSDDDYAKLVLKADANVSFMHSSAASAASKSSLITFQGISIPILNCTSLIPLTNEKIYTRGNGISMTYFINDKLEVIVSMRSNSEKYNVEVMCKVYGEGGHAKAAGFKLPLSKLNDLLTGLL